MVPKLSVVVATYNRRETLLVTLAKLGEQTCSPADYEVIVVDDGSPDDTPAAIAQLEGRTPYLLRFVRQENRGPGAAQNRGIREAQGDLLLLIADDIHATPGLLESHIAFHRSHPEENIAVLGNVLQSPDLPRTTFQRNWDPFRFRQLKVAEQPYWKFWACNISVKRRFLVKHGLYRELRGAAHEDVELGYRLSRSGLRIFFNPDALGYHYHPESLRGAARRAYERGRNWIFIEENVPDPQIHVKYHLLNWHTLGYHVDTFRSISQSSLPPEDRILPWLLGRQLIRWALFNRMTVPRVWLPLLERAETSPMLARAMHPYLYRGAVFYHFLRGYRDARRQRAGIHPSTSTAQPG